MSEKSKILGYKIRCLREDCGISARKMPELLAARGFNIKYPTYMGYESGNSTPNADLFLALCDIFGVKDILKTFGFRSVPAPVLAAPLYDKISRLDAADQAKVEAYTDGLLDQDKYKPASVG